MHAGGADGRAPWRVARIAEAGRTMYLGWPDYRRWRQKISWQDLPDKNNDGKRSLMLDGARGPVRLDVTYIAPDGYSFDFGSPEQEEYRSGGWAYVLRPMVNEDGSRQWYALYPGVRYEVHLAGATTASPESLAAGRGGKPELNLYDLGAGDELRVSSRVSLARLAAGLYELRANCAVALLLPAKEPVFVRPLGGAWRAVTGTRREETVSFRLDAEELGSGVVQLAVGEAAKGQAAVTAEEF
jgi:hypothetical protein